MDKSLIYKAIESGDIGNNISVSQLEEIRSSFPYFSIAQILLAKAYQENNDYRYTDQLHDAAIYSSDRKVLFDRLTRKPIENENGNEDENGNENGNGNEDENGNGNENENENENENGNGNEDENGNENGNENESIERERPQTYGEWMMWKANRLRTSEKTEQNTDRIESNHEEVFNESESPEELASEEISQKTDLGILDKFILAEAVDSSIELEVSEDIRNENENKNEDGNDSVMNPKVAEQQDLIDKFIKAQPKIAPGRANDYPIAANLGKESMEEDFTFATETMAKLFIKQGKIDKARKVYKQLIALYPEKSIYFAAQLKNLNQYKK